MRQNDSSRSSVLEPVPWGLVYSWCGYPVSCTALALLTSTEGRGAPPDGDPGDPVIPPRRISVPSWPPTFRLPTIGLRPPSQAGSVPAQVRGDVSMTQCSRRTGARLAVCSAVWGPEKGVVEAQCGAGDHEGPGHLAGTGRLPQRSGGPGGPGRDRRRGTEAGSVSGQRGGRCGRPSALPDPLTMHQPLSSRRREGVGGQTQGWGCVWVTSPGKRRASRAPGHHGLSPRSAKPSQTVPVRCERWEWGSGFETQTPSPV